MLISFHKIITNVNKPDIHAKHIQTKNKMNQDLDCGQDLQAFVHDKNNTNAYSKIIVKLFQNKTTNHLFKMSMI